jgi:hypothetical protein
MRCLGSSDLRKGAKCGFSTAAFKPHSSQSVLTAGILPRKEVLTDDRTP